MTHVRTQIRERAEVLLEGPYTVIVGLSWPTPDRVLPCCMIVTPIEQVAVETLGPSRQARRQQLKVYCRAEDSDEKALLARLDAMAAHAEERLLVFDAWNGLVQAVNLVATATRVEAADSKKGECELTFMVEYATVEAAPHTAV